jgi:hypothetical protein
MRKVLCTIVLALACAGALGSDAGFARPVEADCAVCGVQAGAMSMAGAQATGVVGTQTAPAAVRAAVLARLEVMRSRLPG